jgi:phytoene/squalene synthetase
LERMRSSSRIRIGQSILTLSDRMRIAPALKNKSLTLTSSRTFLSLLGTLKTDNPNHQADLDHAVHFVQAHDPAGYLPGKLLPTRDMQVSYFAVRSFWIETGLRFGTTAKVPPNSTPLQHLEWWQQGIEHIFDNDITDSKEEFNHPTLRLLQRLLARQQEQQQQWTKCHFDDILKGRRKDIDLKQYATVQSLEEHAVLSCGSLSQLVLESDGLFQEQHPIAHQAAKLVGTCHGLTNALRTSIPVISTTGKLVIPQDLCLKYDIKSPRYLLSALGQGDDKGIAAMRHAVQDIAQVARDHLQQARELRQDIIEQSGTNATSVLLPGLASETFLNRLEHFDFDLTNRDLRHVNTIEHAKCAGRMILASQQHRY